MTFGLNHHLRAEKTQFLTKNRNRICDLVENDNGEFTFLV